MKIHIWVFFDPSLKTTEDHGLELHLKHTMAVAGLYEPSIKWFGQGTALMGGGKTRDVSYFYELRKDNVQALVALVTLIRQEDYKVVVFNSEPKVRLTDDEITAETLRALLG